MTILRVGMIEMSSGDDVKKNTDQLILLYRNLIKSSPEADLILTPENSLFMRIEKGSKMVALKLSDPSILSIQAVVNESKVPLILGSIPLEVEGGRKFRNAMVFLKPGSKPEIIYEKIHLFDVDVEGHPPVRESEVFERGQSSRVLDFKGFKIGLSICYDLRFSDLYLDYARQNVDAIIVPSAFLVPTGKAHWEVLLRARAIESQAYVLAPAQGGRVESSSGGQTRETFGHSLGIDPWGDVLIELDSGNRTGVVELSRVRIEQVRAQIPMKNHRRRPESV